MKRMFALTPLPAALLLRYLASLRPAWVERLYAAGVYPWIAAPASRLMSLCPVPVIEILLIIFVIFMITLFWKKRFFMILTACGLVLALFFGGWGLNYFRLPLEETLDLPVRASTPEELAVLCDKLIEQANARYVPPPSTLTADMGKTAGEAMDAAAAQWPIPKGRFGRPKAALASPLLTRLMIEGIASPFTLEALVNGEIPAVSLPFAACHEAAHVRGFAREEDANLVAYLACEASEDAFARYSGSVCALLYAMNALKGAGYERYLRCWEAISPEVAGDIAERSAFWSRYSGTKAAETAAWVNNAYLGVAGRGDQSARSYGRVVDLLLALARKGEGAGMSTASVSSNLSGITRAPMVKP
ncbi:MAG: DUF3810 domain-containing protein [Firmicutes bacterium]|nr:DUF3810 domain-containing protein [Bacillota bacterium]